MIRSKFHIKQFKIAVLEKEILKKMNYILEIKLFDNTIIPVEIASDVNKEEIIEILKNRNIQIKPSLFNPI